MANGAICHVEFGSTNLDRSQKFYEGLFGWKFQTFDPKYRLFSAPGNTGGGLMQVEKVEAGNSPFVYVEVDEINNYLGKAKQLGGGVKVPKTLIHDNVGWFAQLADPDGNTVGIFQSAPAAAGCCAESKETKPAKASKPKAKARSSRKTAKAGR